MSTGHSAPIFASVRLTAASLAHANGGGSRGGKFKSLEAQQRMWLMRRQAIEPAIGHTKSDHRMGRCWLGGSSGDALHAVLCAAGFNIRWLLQAIAVKGLAALLLPLSHLALQCALHKGSMPFRVERDILISPWLGRTDELASA